MTTTAAPTADERVELQVSDGTRMLAYVARPAHPVLAGPGIIVLQEAYGVNGYLREVTARLANELGCIAIAPELYHRTGDGAIGSYDFDPPKMKEHREGLSIDGQAADVVAAFEWLRAEGVPAKKTAALGFCMGGRVAFLGNAYVPLGAAISLYGGRIAPDWAEYAVKQHGPLLCFWAGLDPHIPPSQRRAVEDALIAAKVVRHTHVVFSDANHGYFRHVRDDVYHPAAARETWAMLVAFLKENDVLN
jgi:carboxymethylenebutenolidase